MFEHSMKQWQSMCDKFWGQFTPPGLSGWTTAMTGTPYAKLQAEMFELYLSNARRMQDIAFAPLRSMNDTTNANPFQALLEWQQQYWQAWFNGAQFSQAATPSAAKVVARASAPQPAVQKPAVKKPAAARSRTTKQATKDDLKQISGIGPGLEKKLNAKGIVSFKQIATLSKKEIENLESDVIRFPGRITRDDWIGQAKRLTQA